MSTASQASQPDLEKPWEKFLTLLDHPVWMAFIAFGVYAILAQNHHGLFEVSNSPYFNYQADAFLHKQIHLRLTPPSTHDLILYDGKLYLYWSPFTAILLLPLIAVFGVNFSDVFFTVVIGAVNVGLVMGILREGTRRGIFTLTSIQRILLTVFFAYGTVHLTLAPRGNVWFTGQEVGFMCVAVAYYSVLKFRGLQAFVFAGIALAGSMLTRNALVFAGIWPAYYLLDQHRSLGWRKLTTYTLAAAAPILAAGLLLAGLNIYRFGNPMDFGISYHQMNTFFRENFEQYGYLNLHYVPTNLYYQYIFYPFPLREETIMGGSLFLLSPVFFFALRGIIFGKPRLSVAALVLSIFVVNIPILLLMGTGWIQFGPRYTLDFTVPLLMLTAMGVKKVSPWLLAFLTLIAVVSYSIGLGFLFKRG